MKNVAHSLMFEICSFMFSSVDKLLNYNLSCLRITFNNIDIAAKSFSVNVYPVFTIGVKYLFLHQCSISSEN